MRPIKVSRLSSKNQSPVRITLHFTEIQEIIEKGGWFHFGTHKFNCPNITEEILDFYDKNNNLPSPCSDCYKALIFWSKDYSEQNVRHFFTMMDLVNIPYKGKLNHAVVVFYFDEKHTMNEFIEKLKQAMLKNDVKGVIQWRRACKEFQRLRPDLWKNAKEFLPDN